MVYLISIISLAIGFIARLLFSDNILESCKQYLTEAVTERKRANNILDQALKEKDEVIEIINGYRRELDEFSQENN